MTDHFFYLLRVGLGLEEADVARLASPDWTSLLSLARRQAVLGILMAGAEKLTAAGAAGPDSATLLQWIGAVERIRKSNRNLDAHCAALTDTFASIGLQSCILKGQGVARFYPDPELRQCGDIDIWVRPQGVTADPDSYFDDIISRIRGLGKGELHEAVIHHVDWQLPDLGVEVHYRMLYFNRPRSMRRLQQWSQRQWQYIEAYRGFYHPAPATDAVYLLVHLYRHLLIEGIGLRQVIDYAMLLMAVDFTADQLADIRATVEALDMTRFARGMAWVLHTVLHVPEARLPWTPDAAEGAFFLDEVMAAGNFGKYDTRINHRRTRTVAGRFWERTKHRARFAGRYPAEIVWDIPFRFRHWWWRRHHRAKRPAKPRLA